MKIIYRFVAIIGLLMVLIPSFLYYYQRIDPGQMKLYMAIGTLLWFAGAIPWLGQKKTEG
jgi:hypothetical protein